MRTVQGTMYRRHLNRPRLTRYWQTDTRTNTAKRRLPISLNILKTSNSSGSESPSSAAFSLATASCPRSFMASSNRDRYVCRPLRGEPLGSSKGLSPLGLCRTPATPLKSSRLPPKGSPRSRRGEPLLSGVELREWAASWRKGEGLGEEVVGHGSVLSRSRWNLGSAGRRGLPAA